MYTLPWVEEIKLRYTSSESSIFVLHGNIRDLYPSITDDGDVVFLDNLNLDSHRVLSIHIVVFLKVDADDLRNVWLVFFVTAQEVLDVLVLSQRET